jgi:hypothetical protein
MNKYEEHTYMFSKNDIFELLKKKYTIIGFDMTVDFGSFDLPDDDTDFLVIKTKREYGDKFYTSFDDQEENGKSHNEPEFEIEILDIFDKEGS